MTLLLILCFWLLALLVVFPYIGYPLTLWALTRLRGAYRPASGADDLPTVSFIISAFNEAAVLDAKLDNARALDYPADKFQIVVISDASDDGTDDIVLRHAAQDPRIVLHRQNERRGKTAGLNHGIEKATGSVVVFSDANAMYEPGAIRELVGPLADPKVGYVVGAAHYSDGDAGQAQHSEGLYWRYELAIKEMESAYGSVVGGDGAIYAIRRELFWPLREDDINDFVNPLQIISAGYRGVFNAKARCYEEGADSFGKEFKRKRRIVNRSWRACLRYGAGVRRANNPAFLFQLIAHKVIRWFAMPLIVLLAVVNLALVLKGVTGIYVWSLLALALSAGLAIRGHQLTERGLQPPKLVYLSYYFYLVNIAAVLGIYDEFRGIRHSKWDHVRSSAAQPAGHESATPTAQAGVQSPPLHDAGKRIGVIALVPEAWQGVVTVRHQVLSRLARHMPVVWMEPALNWRDYYLPSGRRFLRGARWTTPVAGLEVFEPGLNHPAFMRPAALRRHTLASRLALARRRLQAQGVDKIALYLWRPGFSDAIDLVDHDFVCYHIDDDYSFSDTPVPMSPQEAALIRAADQVIVNSPALYEGKGDLNPHTAVIPNGVDFEAFSSAHPVPDDLARLPAPRVGYIGWIKKQLDFECVKSMARARPDCSFVLVGPIGNIAGKEDSVAELKRMSNVHFLGVKPVDALPAYAQHFDVCLMCYEVNEYTNHIYPLKLHEYLAAGRPTISAAINTAMEFSGVLEIASGEQGWLEALERSLDASANSPERIAQRQALAREHDWNALVDDIAKLFKEGIARKT